MEPRERSCLDRPSGLLFILAGAPTPPPPTLLDGARASKINCLAVTGFLVVGGAAGGQYRTCARPFGSAGFPAPTLTPGCSNGNISCLVPAVAACEALNNVAEMGRLLGLRLNEGHLVRSHLSSQTLEAVEEAENSVFATAARLQ